MKKIAISIIILFTINSVFGQRLASNSVGLVYLINDWIDSVELKIVFPIENLLEYKNDPHKKTTFLSHQKLKLKQKVDLFYQNGHLGELEIEDIEIRFWCENDGGIQYRPETNITIPKSAFINPLPPADNFGIISFVVTSRTENFRSLNQNEKNLSVKRSGDYNNDGLNEVMLYLIYDEAESCINELDSLIILRTQGKDFTMSCCGP